jgi:DNA-binding winged helix-turn-helix (wHTH) protein
LLDVVWPNTAIEPQAVKNNIFNLRRALGDASKRAHFIETIPRRGYRFIATIENGTRRMFRVHRNRPHVQSWVVRTRSLNCGNICSRDPGGSHQGL